MFSGVTRLVGIRTSYGSYRLSILARWASRLLQHLFPFLYAKIRNTDHLFTYSSKCGASRLAFFILFLDLTYWFTYRSFYSSLVSFVIAHSSVLILVRRSSILALCSMSPSSVLVIRYVASNTLPFECANFCSSIPFFHSIFSLLSSPLSSTSASSGAPQHLWLTITNYGFYWEVSIHRMWLIYHPTYRYSTCSFVPPPFFNSGCCVVSTFLRNC